VGKSWPMSSAGEAARKGLDLGVGAIRHAAWWLRWQMDRQACREVTELVPLQSPCES
jgi:hypothetical protein